MIWETYAKIRFLYVYLQQISWVLFECNADSFTVHEVNFYPFYRIEYCPNTVKHMYTISTNLHVRIINQNRWILRQKFYKILSWVLFTLTLRILSCMVPIMCGIYIMISLSYQLNTMLCYITSFNKPTTSYSVVIIYCKFSRGVSMVYNITCL